MSSALQNATKHISKCRKFNVFELAWLSDSISTGAFPSSAGLKANYSVTLQPGVQSACPVQDGLAYQQLRARQAPKHGKLSGIQGSIRAMSTGGISGKEYMWAIREEKKKQLLDEQSAQQGEAEEEIPFSALLNQAGYADVHDALQRVLIGAYQLLQKGEVDQAEYLVAEGGVHPRWLRPEIAHTV